jgi:hypothetical protein
MTALDLTRLKELAQAATAGPWGAGNWTCHAPTTITGGADGETIVGETTGFGRSADECAIDAAYIAAANPAVVLELIARLERAEATTNAGSMEARHPIQPLVTDAHGRLRFKRNAIVDHLAEGKLNDLACMDFPQEDWEQLAQLIGYSLDGFGTLSYVTDETYNRAAAQGADPNDPLDDVLPLPVEKHAEPPTGKWVVPFGKPMPDPASDSAEAAGLLNLAKERGYTGPSGQEWAQKVLERRQPKALPDNLPASLDLNDKENGDAESR